MKRLAIGSVAAAVALFIWGAVFWMGPWSSTVFHAASNQAAFGEQLKEQLGETGVYLVPWHPDDMEAMTELHKAGPVAMVHFRREGTDPMSSGTFAGGLLHMLVSAFLVGSLLQLALPVLGTYGARVKFVAVAGLAAAVVANLGKPIWWHQTWGYHLQNGIHDLSSWLVLGLVLAWFVRPETSS